MNKIKHMYCKLQFKLYCVVWPWFQVRILKRRIVRWKLLPVEIIVLNPNSEIKLVINEKDKKRELENIIRSRWEVLDI